MTITTFKTTCITIEKPLYIAVNVCLLKRTVAPPNLHYKNATNKDDKVKLIKEKTFAWTEKITIQLKIKISHGIAIFRSI